MRPQDVDFLFIFYVHNFLKLFPLVRDSEWRGLY